MTSPVSKDMIRWEFQVRVSDGAAALLVGTPQAVEDVVQRMASHDWGLLRPQMREYNTRVWTMGGPVIGQYLVGEGEGRGVVIAVMDSSREHINLSTKGEYTAIEEGICQVLAAHGLPRVNVAAMLGDPLTEGGLHDPALPRD